MNHSFITNVVFRLLAVVIPATGFGWSLSLQNMLWPALFLSALVFMAFNLIFYQNRVNRRINFFFEAVKNEDFSTAFPGYKNDRIIRKLNQHLSDVNEQIQRIQIENHQKEQYFRTLIEQVGTGILTFDEKGFVVHANSAVKKILGLERFTHLKQLEKTDAGLSHFFSQIRNKGQQLISFNGKQGKVNISVKAGLFKNNGQNLTLLSVQDIKKELDEKELDSWMRLIRVLTHEIMNSIAPVTSLTESLSGYFQKEGKPISPEAVNEKMINTTIRGLEVIKEQGRGLISFVESYRKLTRLPKPNKQPISVNDLLGKMLLLNKSRDNHQVQISVKTITPDITIQADEKMISQVLINLIKNAQESLSGINHGKIELSANYNKTEQVEIRVKDNGPGIPAELLDEIFIPFFTTRENGTGIGLSLSKQILRMHGGSLSVNSVPNKQTVFCLLLNL